MGGVLLHDVIALMGKHYDATSLAASYKGPALEFLIDQGTADKFLAEQLHPLEFVRACSANGSLRVRFHNIHHLRLVMMCLNSILFLVVVVSCSPSLIQFSGDSLSLIRMFSHRLMYRFSQCSYGR